MFAVGHVAQVEMNSDFIDLGKNRGRQPGEGDQNLCAGKPTCPPGARIQARTRPRATSCKKIFATSARMVPRGDGRAVLTKCRRHYGARPRVYQSALVRTGASGATFTSAPASSFLSPSPRRFVQVQLILSSDRPTTASRLCAPWRSKFTDAFPRRSHRRRCCTRTAEAGMRQLFSFHITPEFASRKPRI